MTTDSAKRADGRTADQLRPITFQRDFTHMAAGSVLVSFGATKVLCTASVDESVPRWMKGSGQGWVTAEYSMLPGASPERIRREVKAGHPSGRTQEIQRLIGRSLRAVTDMAVLGERQILLDCDVLQADGGTRTAAICGAWVALHDACTRLISTGGLAQHPIVDECAAISVGLIDGQARLDLPYEEDVRADVDMNVVMTGSGGFIEVQGTAEGNPYSRSQLDQLLELAESGIATIAEMQRDVISEPPHPR